MQPNTCKSDLLVNETDLQNAVLYMLSTDEQRATLSTYQSHRTRVAFKLLSSAEARESYMQHNANKKSALRYIAAATRAADLASTGIDANSADASTEPTSAEPTSTDADASTDAPTPTEPTSADQPTPTRQQRRRQHASN